MNSFLEHWAEAQSHFPILLAFAINIVSALSILIIGFITARWFRRRLLKSKVTLAKVDPTLRPVISSSVFYLILALTTYAFMTKLGIPPHSLLAVFGAAGLAIGLALKDTLSNIASGVMLLVLRPLALGEFIETPSFSGTVLEIGLFATSLKNPEGLSVFIPNGQIWAERVMNYNRHSERKFMEDVSVGYDTDLEKIQAALIEVMEQTEGLQTKQSFPECYVMNFGESAITLSCRCWLSPDNWLARASNLRIKLKQALDLQSVETPYPKRVVYRKNI